jgi:xylan 1,4-beta-xylosidase
MYGAGGGDNGYLRLYDSTAVAVMATDSLVKLGGPAENGGSSPGFIATLITHCRTAKKKLDFVTYHRYSNDFDAGGTHDNDAVSLNNFHKTIVDVCKTNNFTGPIFCTEWGSSYSQGRALHDNEMAASFIAKTIHLINTNDTLTYPPPFNYGWWAISDIYEETNNTGGSSAFAGCYGLLTRGSASIPQSWDVAKPAFNAYKLLHKLGKSKLSCTGGTTSSPGVNALATISATNDTIDVLVYSHVDNTTGNSLTTDNISLSISGIPSVGTTAKMEHWVVDRTHSNSYQTWVGLTSPANPSAAQWTQIANAAQLAHYDSAATVTLTGTAGNATYTKSFTQNYYSVGLIQLTNFKPTMANNPKSRKELALEKSNIAITGKSVLVSLPYSGQYTINLYSTSGRKEVGLHTAGPVNGSIALGQIPAGTYLLECSGPAQKLVKTVMIGK